MPRRRNGSSGQPDLIPRSKKPTIPLPDNHPMVVLTDTLDWTELEARAEKIRERKLKNAAGRPPHLRATLGALTLMAIRRLPYREVEEQIRYYAPARYLCGLTETDWTPDFTTVQDFAQLMGEDGVRLINEAVVEQAVSLGLADPKVAVADTTAQEAAIPYPNEMGLLAGFVRSVESAAGKAGQAIKRFVAKASGKLKAAKEGVRRYRLFAKTKEAKDRAVAQMANLIGQINGQLGKALDAACAEGNKLRGYGVVARRKLGELHQTVAKLLPQIRHWLRTGFVAAGKIINLHIPQLYSVVRGKVGKTVEFGLSWGITRLRGGFVLATMAHEKTELHDKKFALRAVEDLIALFGKAPRAYAYDRGGHSTQNVERLRNLGVRDVGLAPPGRACWQVSGRTREQLVAERALVEGSIGTIKSPKYGFNRPAARSAAMMGVCGQRAVLGLNLTKLVRGVAEQKGVALVA
ncbi:MAG: transposase [Deltaproteobacteria bacterium]|nr:transposase [Deltaproteobacteria bacterium]